MGNLFYFESVASKYKSPIEHLQFNDNVECTFSMYSPISSKSHLTALHVLWTHHTWPPGLGDDWFPRSFQPYVYIWAFVQANHLFCSFSFASPYSFSCFCVMKVSKRPGNFIICDNKDKLLPVLVECAMESELWTLQS